MNGIEDLRERQLRQRANQLAELLDSPDGRPWQQLRHADLQEFQQLHQQPLRAIERQIASFADLTPVHLEHQRRDLTRKLQTLERLLNPDAPQPQRFRPFESD